MAMYEMQRHCTDEQINVTRRIIRKGVGHTCRCESPDLVRKFTKLQEQLAHIPKLRNDLHGGILKYIAELQKGGSQSVVIP